MRPITQSRNTRHLFGVVEDDAEGVAGAAVEAAYGVAESYAVVAAGAFYGAIPGGENNGLALLRADHFGFGLRAGLLFDEDKFSTFPVAARLAQKEDHLEGKADLAVEVLMEAVVAAGFVVQDQRSGFGLSGFVTDFQEGGMIGRVGRVRFAQRFRPLIGNFREVRIGTGS